MTATTALSQQGTGSSGVSFATDQFTFDVSEMNAVITAYNTANSTSYPIWDTVSNNYEKFIHFLTVYNYIQELALGNDTFNLKRTSVTPSTQSFGTRGNLNSRIIATAFPFSNASDVYGDSDNLG